MDLNKADIETLLEFDKNNKLDDYSKEEQITILERLVHFHNKKYFINNDPIISDKHFDELTQKLRDLDPKNPVLFEIVGDIGEVNHSNPMLSMDKRFDYEDVKEWVLDVNDEEYLIEPKYDGMRARYYRDEGTLATRGNGETGEDITRRLKDLNTIGDLDENGEYVDGEIIIPNKYFEENLADDYKNSRNAVVGIVKAKQVTKAGIKALNEGGVHFVLFDQVYAQRVKREDLLKKEEWEAILEESFQSEYPLDGVVLKATNKALRNQLGATQHHYRWELAYKLPAEKKWSKVVNITDSVGRTGRVTSIANIEPIELSGATVTNVTLHNYEYLKESNIGVGSKVEVMRSGEVIPFITQVEPAEESYDPPVNCPVCNTELKVRGKYLECPNIECPARLSQSIEYFFKSLDVDELGLKTIEKFIDIFDIESVVGFYDLKVEDIAPLEGFGEKSAKKITDNLQETLDEQITPSQLLQALGIKEIGPATSQWIIDKHGFENLPDLKQEDLEEVDGVGPKKAQNFIDQIDSKWWIVEELNERGLKLKKEKVSNIFENKSFLATGSFKNYQREDIKELVRRNGGDYKSGVTKNLDYLIVGENPGSKLQKAEEGDVTIISEDDFASMID